MPLTAWGRHPILEAEVLHPGDSAAARAAMARGPLIPYGLGRSYGDSALGQRVLMTDRLGLLLGFDPAKGELRAQAGLSLDEILKFAVPRGWFPEVTPGTKYVTVGGAIAADVHGKNHHLAGCFSSCVLDLDLLLPDGRALRCSPAENAELFRATCGGMGLTGLILAARLRLRPLRSALIDQVTYKARHLEEVLELFERERSATYSVAWIDCLAQGPALGRSLLMLGEHAPAGGLRPHGEPSLSLPLELPLVRPWTMRAFNALYYHRVLRRRAEARIHYEPFFYPLDKVRGWNLAYGRSGFTQYQFVLPKAAGPQGLRAVLERIAASGRGSSLAVLKVAGPENANLLSFPMEGYTLALDFKLGPGLFELLEELDAQVGDLGGRVYLAKDLRLGEQAFKRGYPRWRKFQELRERIGARGRLASLQSRRLGLD